MAAAKEFPHATARAFERALTDRVASTAKSSRYGVAELRRQFAFGRLLARVFLHQPELWVLKGATGLLARIPGKARHSIDIDFYYSGQITTAIDALRDATELDLGDFFTFDIDRGSALGGATAGYQLRATAYLGDKVFEKFRVDVVVSHTMTSEPETVPAIEPVEIPGLRSVPYRAYPIADQIADKHVALLDTYADRPSTRYRDLVDLVLIATTQAVEAGSLQRALLSEHRRRGISATARLSLPSTDWPEGYRKVAVVVPGFTHVDVEEAIEIARWLVEPVLAGLTSGVWDPVSLNWGTS